VVTDEEAGKVCAFHISAGIAVSRVGDKRGHFKNAMSAPSWLVYIRCTLRTGEAPGAMPHSTRRNSA